MSGSPSDRRARGRRRREPGERAPPDRQQAWDYLLNVLSRQAYTKAELRAKLARRKVPESLAEELIGRLAELNLVDDSAYAEQYVSSRRESRGRLALSAELKRKGVADEIVAARVGSLEEEQQLAAAVGILRKHAWRYRPEEAPAATGAQNGATTSHANGAQTDAATGRAAGTRSGAAPSRPTAADEQPEEDEYAALRRLRQAEAKAKSFLARRGFSPDVVVAAVEQVGWFGS